MNRTTFLIDQHLRRVLWKAHLVNHDELRTVLYTQVEVAEKMRFTTVIENRAADEVEKGNNDR